MVVKLRMAGGRDGGRNGQGKKKGEMNKGMVREEVEERRGGGT